MNHIFDSINTGNMFITTNGILSSLFPIIALVMGISFGFLIIDFIVNLFKGQKTTEKEEDEEEEEEEDFYFNKNW